MIDFQANIIGHRNAEIATARAEIASLHKVMRQMQDKIYQLSGDMNVLAMQLYHNQQFVKEINHDGASDSTAVHTAIVHIPNLGRIAILSLDSGNDEETGGQERSSADGSENGAVATGPDKIPAEGAQTRAG
jgi:TolA-binding protein